MPTIDIDKPIADPISKAQVDALRVNCAEFGVPVYSLGNIEQGIVHVVGPQLGLTQPGMTVVCGDSHTSTHGAFGALAFGIGTSEVEHVLATQTLPLKPFKTMAITVDGDLPPGVTAKDITLAVIARIGTGGGQGYVLEYRGSRHPGAVDGRPHDAVQHVHRGRRPRGHDRPGRDDLRLPRGSSARARRRRMGRGRRLLANAADRRGCRVRRRGRHRRRDAGALRHVGHQPRPGPAARARRCPSPGRCARRGRPGGRSSGRWSTWT